MQDLTPSPEKLSELQSLHPDILEQCERNFNDEWDKAKKTNQKMNFSIKTVIQSLEAKSGQRYENEAPMMWKGAYKEFARSAAGGFLTGEEVEANWSAWLNDPAHPRDNDGPRGFVQLAIPDARKRLVSFNELGQNRALQLANKFGKQTTDADLAAKAKELTTGFDAMAWDLDGLTGQAAKSMGLLKAPGGHDSQDR